MGRLRNKREIEEMAARLVVSALGAVSAEQRDGGGGEQLRDFDLIFDDGHEEPLEVTLDAQDAVLQSWNRLDRANELQVDLQRYWMASPNLYDKDGRGSVVQVRELRAFLVPVLQEMERRGVYEFRTLNLWSDASLRETAARLSAFGIHEASSIEVPPEHDDTPRLHLASTYGGAVSSDLITRAIEEQAWKYDNRAKLAARRDCPERHLYVGLTSAGTPEGMAFWALIHVLDEDGDLPPIPSLPEEITTVWAGTGSGAIYVTPPAPWRLFRYPGAPQSSSPTG